MNRRWASKYPLLLASFALLLLLLAGCAGVTAEQPASGTGAGKLAAGSAANLPDKGEVSSATDARQDANGASVNDAGDSDVRAAGDSEASAAAGGDSEGEASAAGASGADATAASGAGGEAVPADAAQAGRAEAKPQEGTTAKQPAAEGSKAGAKPSAAGSEPAGSSKAGAADGGKAKPTTGEGSSSGSKPGAGGSVAGSSDKAGDSKAATSGAADGKSVPPSGAAAGTGDAAAKGSKPAASEVKAATVTVSIVGPSDVGDILAKTEVEIEQEDTVLDVLKRVTRENKIHMEFRGRGATAYIEGIDNIYEFDYGSGSGWMYNINGKYPNRGAGVWTVKAGQHIEWRYTEDLGNDLGVEMGGLWDGKEE
ncbi:DUF4430 domain-containing protein [Paenibacillus sp. SYP-B4298]|uniref:DUF4430 domain-containing protein n=1 Tax=Paenibacillus sp. SYP-B4298 TaxID=2996034 RepID=UPI0022DDBF10|nr:DUF4430 domain-containing protein [Paenibacillus sp. SYP-B4298]